MRDSKVIEEFVVKNEITSIQKEISRLMDQHAIELDEILLCGEYTGQYTYPLCCVCRELGLDLWLENPYTIKHAGGFNEERMIAWMPARLLLMPAGLQTVPNSLNYLKK
ncbi:hypothetical protein EZS27_019821 [termite gut metagenome]|uniref:Uncharacterized protein n=1 Tax=termite gut metagenome TaxID=433724 RepID=A0A5J4RD26_9ZZZZ